MKYLAMAIAAISAILVTQNWNTPLAIAWTVSFCGWLPHCFSDQETTHGN